ncbi:hypothetical protein D3C80_1782160 [compost metagenome]
MAVGCVGEGIGLIGVEGVKYRALLVGCQQCAGHPGIELIQLRQQLLIMLKKTPPGGALNLGGQSVFAVKALNCGLLMHRAAILTIQRIVVIAAQNDFTG